MTTVQPAPWHDIDWTAFKTAPWQAHRVNERLDALYTGTEEEQYRALYGLLREIANAQFLFFSAAAPLFIDFLCERLKDRHFAHATRVLTVLTDASRRASDFMTTFAFGAPVYESACEVNRRFAAHMDTIGHWLDEENAHIRQAAVDWFGTRYDDFPEAAEWLYERLYRETDHHTRYGILHSLLRGVRGFMNVEREMGADAPYATVMGTLRWISGIIVEDGTGTPKEMRTAALLFATCSTDSLAPAVASILQTRLAAFTASDHLPKLDEYAEECIIMRACRAMDYSQLHALLNNPAVRTPVQAHRIITGYLIAVGMVNPSLIERTDMRAEAHTSGIIIYQHSQPDNYRWRNPQVSRRNRLIALQLIHDSDLFWELETNLLSLVWGLAFDRDTVGTVVN